MRRISMALVMAGLLVGVAAAPASATIDIQDRWTDSWNDTFSECGVERIQVVGEAHGTFMARALKDSDGQAWLGHNNYYVHETFTNLDNGRSFSLTQDGNWREVRGTQLEGNIWAFEWKDSGANWVLRDGSGAVVWRDRGTISGTDIVDVLGDGEVGGDLISSDLTSLRGKYMGFNFCEDMVQPYLG